MTRDYEDGALSAKNVILPDNVNLRGVYSTALRRGLMHLNSAHEVQGRFDAFCMIIDEFAFTAISEILEQAKLRMADVVKSNPHKSRIAYFLSGLFWASKPEPPVEPAAPAT